jgi:calcineurin-like phosphoesterase family protein
MKHWFTGDTHFGHANIIGYCDRPFADIVAHDEGLIANWNAVVGPDDEVRHLGDFALTTLTRIREIVPRLNGKKYLVLGNHDRHSKKAYREAGFHEVSRACSFNVDDKRIYLQHNPRLITDLWGYDLALCGHVHERWRETLHEDSKWGEKRTRRIINVGVDVWDFRPVSLEELLAGGP